MPTTPEDQEIEDNLQLVFKPDRCRQAIAMIRKERERQVDDLGFDGGHDDASYEESLTDAAECYFHHALGTGVLQYKTVSLYGSIPKDWPWDFQWWKPRDMQADLVRAGALCWADMARSHRNHVEWSDRTCLLMGQIIGKLSEIVTGKPAGEYRKSKVSQGT